MRTNDTESKMTEKIIYGNWKMNGSRAAVRDLAFLAAQKTDARTECGIAVPFPYLAAAAEIFSGSPIAAGAQDVSRFAGSGAYTGEVCAAMLQDCGAQFVLVGHSERRAYFGEDNAILAAKIENALQCCLKPVLCVGETAEERRSGKAAETVRRQLGVLRAEHAGKILIAYEPVWAIGTGEVADAAQICAMHTQIHEYVLTVCGQNGRIPLLYGGSVNAANAENILEIPFVDGTLVGGASLDVRSFLEIVRAAERLQN